MREDLHANWLIFIPVFFPVDGDIDDDVTILQKVGVTVKDVVGNILIRNAP